MKTLKELYESTESIKESEIPESCRESFKRFMVGSTCQAETDNEGKIVQFIYYNRDFRNWYNSNEALVKAYERESKIDSLLK